MNKTLSLVLLLSVALVGCKKDDKKTEAEATPKPAEAVPAVEQPKVEEPAPAAAGGDFLMLADAKLTLQSKDKQETVALSATGEIKVEDKVVATLSKDGKMTTADGKVVATMTQDGMLSFEGEAEKMVIAADGAVSKDGQAVASIGADGVIAGPMVQEGMGKVTYEGPAEAKQAMMFAMMAATMSVEGGDTGATAGTAATAPAEIKPAE